MLASVLNSERAIKVNIQVIRVFNKIREMLLAHKDILLKLEQMQQKLAEHDNNILLIFEYLKQLEQAKQEELEKSRRTIIKDFQGSKPKK
jgi:Zn-dependent M16 (insulinase) family peptidase